MQTPGPGRVQRGAFSTMPARGHSAARGFEARAPPAGRKRSAPRPGRQVRGACPGVTPRAETRGRKCASGGYRSPLAARPSAEGLLRAGHGAHGREQARGGPCPWNRGLK